MTQDEADFKAKSLYGPSAYAEEKNNKHEVLKRIMVRNYNGQPLPVLLGWGDTWEEALTLAAERAEWHAALPKPGSFQPPVPPKPVQEVTPKTTPGEEPPVQLTLI